MPERYATESESSIPHPAAAVQLTDHVLTDHRAERDTGLSQSPRLVETLLRGSMDLLKQGSRQQALSRALDHESERNQAMVNCIMRTL
jgi:hypothetical protein